MIDFRGIGAGKRFEDVVLQRLRRESEFGNGHFGRYGVQAAVHGRTSVGDAIAQLTPSLPDIEGLIAPSGRQVIFDCKVISGSSFNLWKYRAKITKDGKVVEKAGVRRRQLDHMLQRSRYGAICFFLLHWNSRELKTISDETMTVAVPVHYENSFWVEFEDGGLRSISRAESVSLGYIVEWNKLTSRERNERPDVLAAIHQMIHPQNDRIVFDAWNA